MEFLPNFLFTLSSVSASNVSLWLFRVWGPSPKLCPNFFHLWYHWFFCHSFNPLSLWDKTFIASVLVSRSQLPLHHTPLTTARVILKHSHPYPVSPSNIPECSHDQLFNFPHRCCPFPLSSPQGSLDWGSGAQLCIFRDLIFIRSPRGFFTPTKLLRLSCSQNKFQGTHDHLIARTCHQLLSVFFQKNKKDSGWSERRAWGADQSSWTT